MPKGWFSRAILFLLRQVACLLIFYTMGNCSIRPRRFVLFGYNKNYDRRAHSLQARSYPAGVTRFVLTCVRWQGKWLFTTPHPSTDSWIGWHPPHRLGFNQIFHARQRGGAEGSENQRFVNVAPRALPLMMIKNLLCAYTMGKVAPLGDGWGFARINSHLSSIPKTPQKTSPCGVSLKIFSMPAYFAIMLKILFFT